MGREKGNRLFRIEKPGSFKMTFAKQEDITMQYRVESVREEDHHGRQQGRGR